MPPSSSSEVGTSPPWLPHLLKKVQSLRFGSIQIKVHDGQVVLVESLEQKRFYTAVQENEGKGKPKSKNASPTKP